MPIPSKSVAIVILTRDEGLHLKRCLDAVSSFAATIHIIDSGSKDDTLAVARSFGAQVLYNKWVNYADQFQWGMDNIATDATWVMRLDADEVIEPDLAAKIRATLPTLPDDVVGINIDRKHIFLGRWIRHGGRYPLRLLRLFRRGHGRIEQRWMDEHIIVQGGRTVTLAGGFADHNLNDLTFFTDKHNKYATREAVDQLNQKYSLFARDVPVTAEASSRQAAAKRWIKENVYNHIPFTVSATLYFLYRYLFQLGFLDGREGAIYHFLQGFWYRFLVGAKVLELERAIAPFTTQNEKRNELKRLTGLSLGETSTPIGPLPPDAIDRGGN